MQKLDIDTQVLNILNVYASSTPLEKSEGRKWYLNARAEAKKMALRHGYSLQQAAAVIAALSPQVAWSQNLKWANSCMFAHSIGMPLPRRGLTTSTKRAQLALDGDLSDINRKVGTRKVYNFYHSIIGTPGAVCIDRHAIRVAQGEYNVNLNAINVGIYDSAANAYREAAGELKIRTSSLQAITWLVQKRLFPNPREPHSSK